MTKRKKYCSYSGMCENKECEHWVDVDKYHTKPIALSNFKDDGCGFIPNDLYVDYKAMKFFIE